jgi:type II secretory pathway component PulC
VFNTLAKQKKSLPLLAVILALCYLLVAALPLLNHLTRIAPPNTSTLAISAVSTSSDITPSKALDFMQMTDWHLFGQADSETQSSSSDEPLATELELTLQGVFFLAQHQKMAHAIIASADQIQKTYKINDVLPGGAILQAIENNRIILLRENKQEYLELTKTKTGTAEDAESVPEPAAE